MVVSAPMTSSPRGAMPTIRCTACGTLYHRHEVRLPDSKEAIFHEGVVTADCTICGGVFDLWNSGVAVTHSVLKAGAVP
jgi:hypothetical protein